MKIIYVLAKGTADNIVWDNIKKKYSTIDATIGNAGGENNLATVGTITAPVTMPSSSSSSSAVPTGQKKMNEFISSSQQVVSTSSNVLNPYATAAATTTNTTKLIQSQLPG